MAEPISGFYVNDRLKYWIWLALVFGASSTKVYECLRRYEDDPQALYEALTTDSVPNMTAGILRNVKRHSLSEAESILYYCRQHQIEVLTLDCNQYPELLRSIYTPPILLTAQGNLSLFKNPLTVAIVGTRAPSAYTHKVVENVVTELSRCGFVTVSGFAKGVDAVAHSTALASGGSTICVLGCGVNVNYPRENVKLREEVLSSGRGLFVSEYLPGTQPIPANFPRRNRILSGLAHATAVMEAAPHSGSLITADCAAEQGRFLLCVPPADVFDSRYSGVIPMLRDGAIPLFTYQDVLMVYYMRFPQYLKLSDDGIRNSERLVFQDLHSAARKTAKPKQTRTRKQTAKKPVQAEPDIPPASSAERLPESEDGQRIVQFLRKQGETNADDIAVALDMDLSYLLGELTMLEMDGFVETLFGKRYRAAGEIMQNA